MIALLLLLGACEAARIPIEPIVKVHSKPLETDLVAEPSQIYPLSYPRQVVYNVLQVDSNRQLPVVPFPYGRPGSSYVTSSFNYYGTPIYDYQIALSPLYPNINIQPFIPNYIPQQPIATTTQRPLPFDEDKIEKLDEKVDPNFEMNLKNDESQEDDTVVVESI